MSPDKRLETELKAWYGENADNISVYGSVYGSVYADDSSYNNIAIEIRIDNSKVFSDLKSILV